MHRTYKSRKQQTNTLLQKNNMGASLTHSSASGPNFQTCTDSLSDGQKVGPKVLAQYSCAIKHSQSWACIAISQQRTATRTPAPQLFSRNVGLTCWCTTCLQSSIGMAWSVWQHPTIHTIATPPLPKCSKLKMTLLVGVQKIERFPQPLCRCVLDGNIGPRGNGGLAA